MNEWVPTYQRRSAEQKEQGLGVRRVGPRLSAAGGLRAACPRCLLGASRYPSDTGARNSALPGLWGGQTRTVMGKRFVHLMAFCTGRHTRYGPNQVVESGRRHVANPSRWPCRCSWASFMWGPGSFEGGGLGRCSGRPLAQPSGHLTRSAWPCPMRSQVSRTLPRIVPPSVPFSRG